MDAAANALLPHVQVPAAVDVDSAEVTSQETVGGPFDKRAFDSPFVSTRLIRGAGAAHARRERRLHFCG